MVNLLFSIYSTVTSLLWQVFPTTLKILMMKPLDGFHGKAEVEGGQEAAGVGAAHDEDGMHLVPDQLIPCPLTDVVTGGCQEGSHVVEESKRDNHNRSVLKLMINA